MKKMYKFVQQVLVAMVIAGASIGVVLAAPSFDITTLVSGFIRYTGNGHELTSACPGNLTHDYCYGYGWSGNLQAWGYGYGYKSKDFSGEVDTTQAAEYGFDGDDGSVTVDSVETTQTTATIQYTTNYLARVIVGYSLSTDPEGAEMLGVQEENEFNSGVRTWDIAGLTCGTTYGFGLIATDAGDNSWRYWGTFTTEDCTSNDTGKKISISGSVADTQQALASHNKPLSFRIPAIFLSLGSKGLDVQDLQTLLNLFGTGSLVHEDQIFGPKTYNALKKFQSVFRLNKVDGIYGPETQRAMYEQLTQ